ncbi:MAG: transposase [Desulfobulbaceae bacterium]|nr:transposase [Desulfobulbaceae bacterium]
MPRKARMIVEGESAVYHVMSRTVLDGYVLGDVEKDYLLKLIKHFSSIYFAEILGFCLMGNHFHIVVRMHPGDQYSDDSIRKRFGLYYQNDKVKRIPMPHQLPVLREKWGNLSEFMKEIKQGFSRFYNRRHKRRGFFWSDRFKSVLVEDGETLINCLAYVDLNPVRAGIVTRPDDYRWNSLGYHHQSGNSDSFLSLDFGLEGSEKLAQNERLIKYRQFVYEVGSLSTNKGSHISVPVFAKEAKKGFTASSVDRFLARTRYFTDSGIIGSRQFVSSLWQRLRTDADNPNKPPTRISGLENMYSLKRLSESIL